MKNPYDGRFQDLAEDHPELVLRLVNAIAPGTKPIIARIPRRLRSNPVEIDHGFLLRTNESQHIAHIEAFSRWKSDRIGTLAVYNFLLKQRYKTSVDSVILLMLEKHAPRRIPAALVWQDSDGQRVETPYRTVKLWEVPPEIAFEPGGEPLLDWVPWMKGGLEATEAAIGRIDEFRKHPNEAPYPPDVMASNLALAVASRYDKDKIRDILERLKEKNVLIPKEVFTESWVYRDGVAEGRAEGRVEGQLQAKRDAVASVLKRRFPSIARPAGLDKITDLEKLDRLFDRLVDARTESGAEAAIKKFRAR